MTAFLTLEDLLALAQDLGVGPVRDLGLLESAALRPRTSLFGRDAYPSLDEKAAVLLESIVRNHALIDGNKRLGFLALIVFYGINDIVIEVNDNVAYDHVIEVATGQIDHHESARRMAGWY